MMTYQFDLMNAHGKRSCLLLTTCASDREAVTFAQSPYLSAYSRIYVWRDDVLIHEALRGHHQRAPLRRQISPASGLDGSA